MFAAGTAACTRYKSVREHEAWEVAREHYLILREEPDDEPMPPNPAWDGLVEMNNALDRIAREED